MLIAATGERVAGVARPSLAIVVRALAPTARLARPGPSCLTVVLGAAPGLVAIGRGEAVGAAAVIALALAAGAAAGWAVDDPAAELLAPLPIPSPTRLALRILTVATVVAATCGIVLAVQALGPGLPPEIADRGAEALTAATIALAVGLIAARRGERAAGPVAVTAGALGALVIGGLAVRWPAVFPALGAGPVHERWWLAAAAGVAVAVRSGRDLADP